MISETNFNNEPLLKTKLSKNINNYLFSMVGQEVNIDKEALDDFTLKILDLLVNRSLTVQV